jgi:hypothetical protein
VLPKKKKKTRKKEKKRMVKTRPGAEEAVSY